MKKIFKVGYQIFSCQNVYQYAFMCAISLAFVVDGLYDNDFDILRGQYALSYGFIVSADTYPKLFYGLLILFLLVFTASLILMMKNIILEFRRIRANMSE